MSSDRSNSRDNQNNQNPENRLDKSLPAKPLPPKPLPVSPVHKALPLEPTRNMSSIETRIQQAATKNKELLRILTETDHAVPDLENQKRFVADLEKEVDGAAKRVKDIDRKRQKELKEHEKYRDSVMRRFAYKATGKREKFEAKAEKEEKEYFETLQEEHREKEMEKNLRAQLEEVRRVKRDLEREAQRHKDMQLELDNMYNAIFAGPTPGFPEEDERERASEMALQRYHDTRMKAESQLHAARTLKNAVGLLEGAAVAMAEARGHSRMDMFGGGTMSDMMERNALHKAQIQIQEARHMITMAQREDSQISSMPPVNINTGNLMSDVFFDNIFTDMAFHDEIKRGMYELDKARSKMHAQLERATARYREYEAALKEREGELESTRFALQKAREQAFEQVAGSA